MHKADLEKIGFSAFINCEHLAANLPNLIETDTRKELTGKWYWPLVGDQFDGHKFIDEALRKGAIGFCYQKDQPISSELLGKAPNFAVPHSLSSLQKLANLWRMMHPQCKVIGITGSNGKTTAKEIIAHIVKLQMRTVYSKASFNNEIGLPLTLCQINAQTDVAVLEMGARHVGDIRFLSEIACQDVSILLNIGTAHLGEFGSVENLRSTKQEILTFTPRETIAIVSAEDQITCHVARQYHNSVVTFGFDANADVAIESSNINPDGSFRINLQLWKKDLLEIQLPFFHLALEPNIAAAIALCVSLNLDMNKAIEALACFPGVSRRFEIKHKDALTIIDDSYNANPQSMLSGLKSIAAAYPNHKMVLILGDMLELGDISQKEHEKIGHYVATNLAQSTLMTVGHASKAIADGALHKGMPSTRLHHYDNYKALLDDVDNVVKFGNLLYAKASNGIRLYQVIDYLMDKT